MSTTSTLTYTCAESSAARDPAHLELSHIAPPPPLIASSKNSAHRFDDITPAGQSKLSQKSGADVDIESQPSSPHGSRPPTPPPDTAVSAHNTAMEREAWWKTAACFFSLWIAGVHDGSNGALIPYLKLRYDIGLAFVALVYIATFLGWLMAALTNVHVTARCGMGGVLFIGSCLQLLQYVLQCWVRGLFSR